MFQDFSGRPALIAASVDELDLSRDPKDWARSSCRECYGRGVVTALPHTVSGNHVSVCACAQRRFDRAVVKARRAAK